MVGPIEGDRAMRRRINITLPEETVRLIDRVAKKGNRSRFLDALVRFHLGTKSRQKLRRELQAGYTRWAEQDRRVAEEWFELDEGHDHRFNP